MIILKKSHKFCYGHRIYGHTGKCQYVHGHNATITFCLTSKELNHLGMVTDFKLVNDLLSKWIDESWDHRLLLFANDPLFETMRKIEGVGVVRCGFNPTVENMSLFILNIVGPHQLRETGIDLVKVIISETDENYVETTRQ